MPPTDANDPSDDALFAALENEDDSSYRAERIQQLNAEFASHKTNRDTTSSTTNTTTSGGVGGDASLVQDNVYPTLNSDQAVLDFTTQTNRCIIHFAHPDFGRCGVMDEHLALLAGRHYEVRFARVDVRNTPFVVEKLGIRVLPCVIGFKDGVGVDRVVGFEGLGNGGKDGMQGFSVQVLEKRLLWKGLLVQAKVSSGDDDDEYHQLDSGSEDESVRKKGLRRAIRGGNARLRGRNDDDDVGDDWD